jgi:predicted O-linked N-acetylglucosamine transferase (SPINDLY family)
MARVGEGAWRSAWPSPMTGEGAAFDALLAAGRQALEAGDLAGAAAVAGGVVAVDAGVADAWMLLGSARHAALDLPAALAAFDAVVRLRPERPEGWAASGAVLLDLGRAAEACTAFDAAAACDPDSPDAHVNAAIARERAGTNEDALRRYERALACDAGHFRALLNRGALLLQIGERARAVANNRALVERWPDAPDAWCNLALALPTKAGDSFDAALAAFDRALALAPRHRGALHGRGMLLACAGRFEEADHCFDVLAVRDIGPPAQPPALRREPHAREVYLIALKDRLDAGEWLLRERLATEVPGLVEDAAANGRPLADPGLAWLAITIPMVPGTRLRLMRSISDRIETAAAPDRYHTHRRYGSGPTIRVGYVSPGFGLHPTGVLTRRLFALHDRTRFEIYGYAVAPHDDAIRDEIERGCDGFREMHAADGSRIARQIHDDGIDILVDLGGYGRGNRMEVFAIRPAPVQVAYTAFLATTGAAFIDYFIADGIACPEGAEAQFRECLARVPAPFLPASDVELPGTVPDRRDLGLPPDAPVLCCFNRGFKYERDTFGVWMRLLHRFPDAVLWLLSQSAVADAATLSEAARHGIEPGRIVFAPVLSREAHLARLGAADLFLDTRAVNAHTTAVDALWAGVPLVACPGESVVSRVSASLLHGAGLDSLVTPDLGAYETRIGELLDRPELLAALRWGWMLRRSNSPVFDMQAKVRHLEQAYAAMWHRYAAGDPPAPIRVAS